MDSETDFSSNSNYDEFTNEILFMGGILQPLQFGATCSSVVRAFAHGTMGHLIDPSWWTH